MTKIMTPSVKTMTAGQIDKAVANYRALLEKHFREFDAEAVQTVLGQEELAGETFAIFRTRVEAISNLVVRTAKVDRTRTAQAALDVTSRKQYTDKDVVDAMPQGTGEEVEVVFFNLGRYISDAELDKEYELRVLKPADPYSLSAVNEDDPAFADTKPNATHWKDSNGKWCYAAFHPWDDDERLVPVYRHGHVWNGRWWFAGVRK